MRSRIEIYGYKAKRDYVRNLVGFHQGNRPSTSGIIFPINLAVFLRQKTRLKRF